MVTTWSVAEAFDYSTDFAFPCDFDIYLHDLIKQIFTNDPSLIPDFGFRCSDIYDFVNEARLAGEVPDLKDTTVELFDLLYEFDQTRE